MPKTSQMFPSKWLKASDFEDGDAVMTIREVTQETIGQGKDAAEKFVLYFEEEERGLVLNKTNVGTIAKLHGDDTDDWIGKQVTLFATEVQFQSEMVEAIRVRSKPPRRPGAKVERPAAPAATPAEDDDQVPF
jgi:hypothetical protein